MQMLTVDNAINQGKYSIKKSVVTCLFLYDFFSYNVLTESFVFKQGYIRLTVFHALVVVYLSIDFKSLTQTTRISTPEKEEKVK